MFILFTEGHNSHTGYNTKRTGNTDEIIRYTGIHEIFYI